MTKNDEKLSKLFNELVPADGKADSLAGEIIRATMRISYRRWNDGDRIGIGYGNETVNGPARFLLNNSTPEISRTIGHMWGNYSERDYDEQLELLKGQAADYVNEHPELREKPTEDMWEYTEEQDYHYDEDDEEEW